MSAHLDLDRMADLLAGEGEQADVDHVGSCARCSAALVDLDEASERVRRLLDGLPAPQAPEDLAARIEAALAAAPPPAVGSSAATPSGPAPVAAGEGAAGAGTAGTGAADTGGHGTGGHDTGGHGTGGHDTGSGALVVPLAPVRSRGDAGRRRGTWLLRAAAAGAAVLALGTGALLVAQRPPTGTTSAAGGEQSSSAPGADVQREDTAGRSAPAEQLLLDGALVRDSGADYARSGELERRVPSLLRDTRPSRAAAPPSAAPGTTAPRSDGLDRLRDPRALAECLEGLAVLRGSGEPAATGPGAGGPLVLDYAAYDRRPALLVLLPGPGATLEAYVVGGGCRRDDPQLLARRSVARPGAG